VKKSHNLWIRAWYGKSRWVYALLPLSWLFAAVSKLRKFLYVQFLQQNFSVPIIVVGNISVGGTGKTPLIIALAKYLQARGYKPGVISRGYGGKAPNYPYVLNEQTSAAEAGDEPLLIYRSAQCPVCVAPDRVAAARELIHLGCTHILSDDGLQHYRLGRAMEIAVVDGQRLFGNRKQLPAGPLREPVARLKKVDFIIINQRATTRSLSGKECLSGFHNLYTMKIQPQAWCQLGSQQEFELNGVDMRAPIHAVAGIGNPERFFNTLDELDLHYYAHHFSDHHQFTAEDFATFGNDRVVMTEKDAVKCYSFAKPGWYSLIISAYLSTGFWQSFQQKLDSL